MLSKINSEFDLWASLAHIAQTVVYFENLNELGTNHFTLRGSGWANTKKIPAQLLQKK